MMHLENMIINDLIREYMEYNNYVHSLSVFGPETGMPDEQLDRNFIAKKLKIVEDSSSKKMPLIYGTICYLSRRPGVWYEENGSSLPREGGSD
jgi:lisH domain-containing protein FOPNL